MSIAHGRLSDYQNGDGGKITFFRKCCSCALFIYYFLSLSPFVSLFLLSSAAIQYFLCRYLFLCPPFLSLFICPSRSLFSCVPLFLSPFFLFLSFSLSLSLSLFLSLCFSSSPSLCLCLSLSLFSIFLSLAFVSLGQ